MGQGRKQLPDIVKKLKGSDRPDRMNQNQPKFPRMIELPEAPAVLNNDGLMIYESLGETLLDVGILNQSNILLFVAFCNEFGIYYSGSRDNNTIEKRIETVHGKTGSYEKVSPRHKIINSAFTNAMKLAPEFGLTPASISKIIRMKSEKLNPIENLLGD